MASDLSDEILERALTGRFGRYRRVYDSIDSTNLEALRWAAEEGAAEGSLVVSDVQTAGRGRWGRTWVAAPGSGLMFSVVLRPRGPTSGDPQSKHDSIGAGLLATAAGLAVADGIQRTSGLPTMLKWPNDVLIAGRKVAGILVEARSGGSAEDAAGNAMVVGAGINLHWRRDDIPADLAESATSIAAEVTSRKEETGWARPDRRIERVPARAELLGAVLTELENLYRFVEAGEGSDEVVHYAAQRSAVIGERSPSGSPTAPTQRAWRRASPPTGDWSSTARGSLRPARSSTSAPAHDSFPAVRPSPPRVVLRSGRARPAFVLRSGRARPAVVLRSGRARPALVLRSGRARPALVLRSGRARPALVLRSGRARPAVREVASEA